MKLDKLKQFLNILKNELVVLHYTVHKKLTRIHGRIRNLIDNDTRVLIEVPIPQQFQKQYGKKNEKLRIELKDINKIRIFVK